MRWRDRVLDFLVVRAAKISVIPFQLVVSRVVALEREGRHLVGTAITSHQYVGVVGPSGLRHHTGEVVVVPVRPR